MDESVLNSYSGAEYRKFILKNFIIKAIISLPQNSFVNAGANVKTSILYLIKKENEEEEQSDIFMGASENIGHTDSGKSDLKHLDLLKVSDYNGDTINISEGSTILDRFIEFEKAGRVDKPDDTTFVLSAGMIKDRLDCYNHQPSYKKLVDSIYNSAKKGKINLKMGKDLNLVKQMSKAEYEQNKTKLFKYIDIGNTEKDLGLIRGYEEDLLINLPTRARMMIKENDVLIPAPVHSASGIIIVPKNLDGQLCSTGFIVIRPDSFEDAVLLYAILKSDMVQKQFFHLQSGINQQSITDDNFKDFVYLPFPKDDKQKRETIDSIKKLREQAISLKTEYGSKLKDIQGEFLKVMSE